MTCVRTVKTKRRGGIKIQCFEAESDRCMGKEAKHKSAQEYFPCSNADGRFQLGGLRAEPNWAKSWAGLAQGTFPAKADIAA